MALMAAAAIAVLLGFGALAVDVAYIRLAQAECQDVADAASIAALWALRHTGDMGEAQGAAEAVIAANRVVGQPGTLTAIDYGDWDHNAHSFTLDLDTPNAVRLEVSRAGGNSVGLFLARIFGHDSVDVVSSATAAARALHVVLVMDITNSWNRPAFYDARSAAVRFYDTVAETHGPYDKIGMNVFTGRYAWEFTPLTSMESAVASGTVRAQWAAMETASKAGNAAINSKGCNVYGGTSLDNFDTPAGGCFPDMPREWSDEPGTDHTTGVRMAWDMFDAEMDNTAYRAMVVLTDGYPNGTGSTHGNKRIAAGYSESRWTEHRGVIPHSSTQIKNESVQLCEDMYDVGEINTWVVSFVADDPFMEAMAQGDGYFVRTNDSAVLIDLFQEIADSLPLAVVE